MRSWMSFVLRIGQGVELLAQVSFLIGVRPPSPLTRSVLFRSLPVCALSHILLSHVYLVMSTTCWRLRYECRVA